MTEPFEITAGVKQCPLCSLSLAMSEFGVCRARKDGRNLYCKSCIRRKVTESRRAQKAYKSIRQQYATQQVLDLTSEAVSPERASARRQFVARQISKMTPVERVREAIRTGAKTQKEIAQVTKLGKDEIGDALANLLLWTHEIRTEVIDNTRVYFVNDVADSPLATGDTSEPKVPQRKRDVPSSFSSLQVLMPGKKNEGEAEKIGGGWVAA